MKISNITTRRKDNLNHNTRIHFFVDETIIENLENRRNRPYTEYRKLLPEVFEKLGIPANTKASWRQNAGCSCGCSPAFIVEVLYHNHVYVDITSA